MGDQGQRLIQIDVSRQMAITDDGRSVFQSVQGSAGYVTSASGANTGSGVFGAVGVTDATAPLYGKDFSIGFAGGNYTVTTNDTPPVVAATGAYTAGTPISFGGVQISMSGTPADGDTFQVATARNAGTDIFAALGERGERAAPAHLRRRRRRAGRAAERALDGQREDHECARQRADRSLLRRLAHERDRCARRRGGSRDLIDKAYLSDLQDLDPAAAISEFLQRQTSLQATQQTFARLHGIALFNYL